jgi:hypothetical protein
VADLLTHYVSSRVAGLGIRDRATLTLFGVGVLLPDLLGKPLGELSGMPHLVAIPTHTPIGLIFACGALSMLFAAELRKRVFWAIYLGSLLHLLVDMMKDYLGRGAGVIFHPFSTRSYELGLYRSEDVFYLLPVNLGILAILWVLARKRRAAGINPASGPSSP